MTNKSFQLEQAEQIAQEQYGDAVRAVIPLGYTKQIGRHEFKVFLKSNSIEIDKEMYLNIFEPTEIAKKKYPERDFDKNPVFEFVDKE